jgi:hypothetical protein
MTVRTSWFDVVRHESMGVTLTGRPALRRRMILRPAIPISTVKNKSFDILKEECDELMEDWEKLTVEQESCIFNQTSLEDRLERKENRVEFLTKELGRAHSDCATRVEACERKSAELQGVVATIQDDLLCLEETANCSYEAGKYTCLPRFFFDVLCMSEERVGQEVFQIRPCLLMGDATLKSIPWGSFIRENPVTSTLVIFGLIFATIGFLTVFLVGLWCVIVCRIKTSNKRGKKNQTPTDKPANVKVDDKADDKIRRRRRAKINNLLLRYTMTLILFIVVNFSSKKK